MVGRLPPWGALGGCGVFRRETVGCGSSAVPTRNGPRCVEFAGTCPRGQGPSRGVIQLVKSVKGAGPGIDASLRSGRVCDGSQIAHTQTTFSRTPPVAQPALDPVLSFPRRATCWSLFVGSPVIAKRPGMLPGCQLVERKPSQCVAGDEQQTPGKQQIKKSCRRPNAAPTRR